MCVCACVCVCASGCVCVCVCVRFCKRAKRVRLWLSYLTGLLFFLHTPGASVCTYTDTHTHTHMHRQHFKVWCCRTQTEAPNTPPPPPHPQRIPGAYHTTHYCLPVVLPLPHDHAWQTRAACVPQTVLHPQLRAHRCMLRL